MKIVYESMPAAASRALRRPREPIANLVAKGSTLEAARDQQVTCGTALRPHPFYFLRLAAILSERGLDSALPIGWRHISVRDRQILETTIESISDQKYRAPQHRVLSAHAQGGAVHNSLIDAGSALRGAYYIRALTVPPLMPLGIWLKPTRKGSSNVLPIFSVIPSLQPHKLVSEKRFLMLLEKHARDLVEFAHFAHLRATEIPHKPKRAKHRFL